MDFQEVLFEIGSSVQRAADFDGNGAVDGGDLLAWQRTLGSPIDRTADGNFDGRVDAADLAIWREDFGDNAPVRSIPEPHGLVIVLAASAIVMRCINQRS
jgi:hypothetical protein